MRRTEVGLDAEQIAGRPVQAAVLALGKLGDDVLFQVEVGTIEKPDSVLLDWPRKAQFRAPTADCQTFALLKPGNKISGAKLECIVSSGAVDQHRAARTFAKLHRISA